VHHLHGLSRGNHFTLASAGVQRENSHATADVSSAPFFLAFRITLTSYLDGYVRDALQAKYPSIAIHFGRGPQGLLKVV